jgi:hypothetical protein
MTGQLILDFFEQIYSQKDISLYFDYAQHTSLNVRYCPLSGAEVNADKNIKR